MAKKKEKKEKKAAYRSLIRAELADELYDKILNIVVVEKKYKDPNYKPMDYRYVKLINMLTTFSNEPCPQAPNLDGLNEILEDQKERAYGKKNVR